MYNINLVRYALTNQCGDSVIYKTRKIIEHYLEVIQDGELLYRFNDKEEACGHLTELIIMKSVNDVPSLGNNDRDLIKLVLENKTVFDENSNTLADIRKRQNRLSIQFLNLKALRITRLRLRILL